MAEPYVIQSLAEAPSISTVAETWRFRVPGISAVPHEDNLRYFDVKIHGPSQSPYEG